MKSKSNTANTKSVYAFAKMLSIILFLILSNLYSFSQESTPYVDHYRTSNFDVAIFPPASAFLIPGTPFALSRTQVDKAEMALNKQLKQLNSRLINQGYTPIIHKNLKKYKRQYFGYINENNERVMFINCFWNKHTRTNPNWLKERVMVNDGGSYYWSVKYNMEKDELFDLDVNGSG